jgi:hypothetical protein
LDPQEGEQMSGTTSRWLTVLIGVASLGAITLPTAQLASAQVSTTALGGQACLVGTWRDDGGRTAVEWRGHLVAMHGSAGDVDHIRVSAKDTNVFARSKPLYGTYRGHSLKEVIRGVNHFSLRAQAHTSRLRWIEHGWSARSTNTFTYKGISSRGNFAQTGTFTFSFTCTAHRLVLIQKSYRDTETRISRKP